MVPDLLSLSIRKSLAKYNIWPSFKSFFLRFTMEAVNLLTPLNLFSLLIFSLFLILFLNLASYDIIQLLNFLLDL